MTILDAVMRLIPGVLGNAESTVPESFAQPLLEYPHYTRPYDFRGEHVPDVLLSGHHERIERWRRKQALLRTLQHRPDLFAQLDLSDDDRNLLEERDPIE